MDRSAIILLLVAGSLGGFAQSLIAGRGRVRVPAWERDASQVDLGFLSDLLIGMIGSLAALVVGLAVLNQQFFGSTEANPSGGLAVPAWVRFMSFGALTGFGSRRLLPVLSDKITNAIAGEVTKQVESSEKRLRQQNETSAEVLQSALAATTAATVATVKKSDPAGAASSDLKLSKLDELVQEYEQISEPDYRKRVALKDACASHMGGVLIQAGNQRPYIVSKIKSGAGEGWVLCLAVAVLSGPTIGDAELLTSYSRSVRRLHVQYNVVNAFYALKLKKLLSAPEANDAIGLMNGFLTHADASLRRNIRATVSYLRSDGNV